MKDSWIVRNFESCIEKCKKTMQLKTSDYLSEGKYPIVSQEAHLISGYTDKVEFVNHFSKPIIVFGDHSRVIKYIDFDFAVGADGVKIIIPTSDFLSKFFFYYLRWHGVQNLGYSRHYKLLKEIKIPIPSLLEQQHIVDELDLLSSIIEKKKKQINELNNLAQSSFYEFFGDPITNEKGWEKVKWKDALRIINGKNQKSVEDVSGTYPIYGSGGIMGYATDFLCPKNTIIIGRKGNINKPILVYEPFWNVDTAFGLVCNEGVLNHYYLYFFCVIFDFENLNKAVTIPSLTKKDLLEIDIPIPPLSLQNQFASKINAIKYQQMLIKKSIREVKILYKSRMDFWFN